MGERPSKRIFVDIGGYHGTSSLAALDPIFGFDIVYCFEPVPFLARGIRKRITSQRLKVFEKALADNDGFQTLHHAGLLAGSMYSEAPAYGDSVGSIQIETLDAAKFFSDHISRDDFVRVKFNCEGAEVQIILRLYSAGLLWALDGALVDFDSEKIATLSGKSDVCRQLLQSGAVKYYEPPEVQYGMVTNFGGVRNWLLVSGAAINGFSSVARSLAYNARMILEHDVNGYHKLRIKKAAGLIK